LSLTVILIDKKNGSTSTELCQRLFKIKNVWKIKNVKKRKKRDQNKNNAKNVFYIYGLKARSQHMN